MFIHIMKQQILLAGLFRGLFFKFWANNRFSFLKMQEGPQRIGKIFILRSDRLENSIKMTAMGRFIYN